MRARALGRLALVGEAGGDVVGGEFVGEVLPDDEVVPAVLGGVGGLELRGALERLAREAHLELLTAHTDQAAQLAELLARLVGEREALDRDRVGEVEHAGRQLGPRALGVGDEHADRVGDEVGPSQRRRPRVGRRRVDPRHGARGEAGVDALEADERLDRRRRDLARGDLRVQAGGKLE